METITYPQRTYTDKSENILFGAKYYGYQETINSPTGKPDPITNTPSNIKIPNPQTAREFLEEFGRKEIDALIEKLTTAPLKTYLALQGKAQIDQAVQVKVLTNLQ